MKKQKRDSMFDRFIIKFDLFVMRVLYRKKFKEIEHCYNEHEKDCGGTVRFTFGQYAKFWLER